MVADPFFGSLAANAPAGARNGTDARGVSPSATCCTAAAKRRTRSDCSSHVFHSGSEATPASWFRTCGSLSCSGGSTTPASSAPASATGGGAGGAGGARVNHHATPPPMASSSSNGVTQPTPRRGGDGGDSSNGGMGGDWLMGRSFYAGNCNRGAGVFASFLPQTLAGAPGPVALWGGARNAEVREGPRPRLPHRHASARRPELPQVRHPDDRARRRRGHGTGGEPRLQPDPARPGQGAGDQGRPAHRGPAGDGGWAGGAAARVHPPRQRGGGGAP